MATMLLWSLRDTILKFFETIDHLVAGPWEPVGAELRKPSFTVRPENIPEELALTLMSLAEDRTAL